MSQTEPIGSAPRNDSNLRHYFKFPLWITLAVLAFLPIGARGQLLTTIAGGGTPSPTPGNEGDGGPATLATMGSPEDIALDSKGNLYIAVGNNKIRRVDAMTGIISTVAGNGAASYTGDGGPATLSTVNYPAGLAVDSQDNLYIADYYNNVVRKISAVGATITTVVGSATPGYSGDGGPATLAQLANPQGIKFDAQGNLFIGDSSNHVVRRVDAITGDISTVAGSATPGYSGDGGPATQAQMNSPEGLAFDPAGNLYVTDDDSAAGGPSVLRKVAAGTGVISTVAGSATPGYCGDGGPATQACLGGEADGVAVDCNGSLLIADGKNFRVRKVSGFPATIATLLGNGTDGYTNNVPIASAQAGYPEALLVHKATGDLYMANYDSLTVQKISPYCPPTATPTPTSTPTATPTASPVPTAIGCGQPIDTYCYPNPAMGTTATILCNLCEPGQVTILIYNSAAELVASLPFQGNTGVNLFSVNIGGFSYGVYYYIARSQGASGNHRSKTAKFAVVR